MNIPTVLYVIGEPRTKLKIQKQFSHWHQVDSFLPQETKHFVMVNITAVFRKKNNLPCHKE